MRALYVSYDGALDPLGATQVLPYLRGLAERGVRFTLISFEKPEKWAEVERREGMRRTLEAAGIAWRPLSYHKTPRVPATLWDVVKGSMVIRQAAREEKAQIVHCRGDVAMAMVRVARLGDGVRVLYDMRGFFSAERVDVGSWRAGSWIDRSVKRAERANRRRADAIVVLTERARETLEREGPLPLHRVIPTCVDTTRFRPRPPTESAQFGVAYVGSLGTWYMAREMVEFCRRAGCRLSGTTALLDARPGRSGPGRHRRNLGRGSLLARRRGPEVAVTCARARLLRSPHLFQVRLVPDEGGRSLGGGAARRRQPGHR